MPDPYAIIPLFLAGFTESRVLIGLVVVRLLSGGLALVLPFLTLYATRDAGISLIWIGVFVAAQKAGGIVSNLSWMLLGNRVGTRAVILSGLALAILSLAVIAVSESAPVLMAAFVAATTLCEPRRGGTACGPSCADCDA